MHIALQNEFYLFQIHRPEFETKRNRDEMATESKTVHKEKKNDFAQLFEKQLNGSTFA